MNGILRKRIEDFASEYAERMYKNSTDGEKRAAKHDVIKGAEFILCRQWISVDEALPEYEEDVLALIGGAPVIAKGYHVRAGLRYNTHWMSIPKFEQQSKM